MDIVHSEIILFKRAVCRRKRLNKKEKKIEQAHMCLVIKNKNAATVALHAKQIVKFSFETVHFLSWKN